MTENYVELHKNRQFNYRPEPQLMERLRQMAKDRGWTVTKALNMAVESWLARMEMADEILRDMPKMAQQRDEEKP